LTGRLEAADQNLVEHLDTPETQTSLDNSKDIIALAKSDLLVGFALNFINRAKLGITIVMLTLSVFV
jgi:hypothetical protein